MRYAQNITYVASCCYSYSYVPALLEIITSICCCIDMVVCARQHEQKCAIFFTHKNKMYAFTRGATIGLPAGGHVLPFCLGNPKANTRQ